MSNLLLLFIKLDEKLNSVGQMTGIQINMYQKREQGSCLLELLQAFKSNFAIKKPPVLR